MRLTPLTYDGFPLNDEATIACDFVDAFSASLSEASINLVQRSGEFPGYGTVQLREKTFSMNITLRGERPDLYRDTLTQHINTAQKLHRTLKQLVCRDEITGNRVYILCTPVTMIMNTDDFKSWTATFVAPDPEWTCVNKKSETHTFTASGQTWTLANSGNLPIDMLLKLTPRTKRSSGAYNYFDYVHIINNFLQDAVNYPLEITNGGWNTAALVTASKMQATGNDLRVFQGNVEINRWLADINTDHTKVWVVISTPAPRSMKLSANIGAGDTVTRITIKNKTSYTSGGKTYTNTYTLKGVPPQGIIRINNEEFLYDGVDVKAGRFTITERAARGTSAGAHTAGDTIHLVPMDLRIVYGNAGAEAPVVDDTLKPVLDLSASTNASWVYSSELGATGDQRAGQWNPSLVSSTPSGGGDYYTATENTDADPYSSMGIKITALERNDVWVAPTVQIQWKLNQPAGIDTFTAAGKKFRDHAKWPTVARFKAGTVVSNITTPSTADTWEAWTKTAVDVSDSTVLVFQFIGSGAASDSDIVAMEMNTLTLALNASGIPTVSLGSEQTDPYNMELNITNSATYNDESVEEALEINLPMRIDQTIILDMGRKIAYKETTGELIMSSIVKDVQRSMWLPLYPGNNVLTFTEIGLAEIDAEVEYYERFN